MLANMSYEEIFAQTPLYNTSVYIRNLPRKIISKLLSVFKVYSLLTFSKNEIIEQDIAPHLQQHGFVSDIHLEADKGTATVK